MSSDATITNYDNIAEAFIAHASRRESWNNLYDRPNILARLPDLKGKNVLDLGCSTGFFTEHALAHGASVTGVDASLKLIDRLKNKITAPALKLHCADIGQSMPFLDSASFDVIICSLVMDYIKNWMPVMAEFSRVLKKGGRAVISTGHPFNDYLYLIRHNRPESYHAFKMLEDTWGLGGPNPFKVHYYIRPLNVMLRPILNSDLKIISIDEPLPDENMRKIDPVSYERLMNQPGFIFFVLEK